MSEPIKILGEGGMCSRLWKLFTFLQRADELGVPIRFKWPVDAHCNGHFLDIFHPLDRVQFVNKIGSVYHGGWHPHPKFPIFAGWWFDELKPLQHIRKAVAGACDWNSPTVAVHARRTDMIRHAANNNLNLTTSESLFRHLDAWFPDRQIFLATDSHATQAEFEGRYGSRLITHKTIKPIKGRRETTLDDAMVDFFGCVAADDFVGSVPSSYSSLISSYHNFVPLAIRRRLSGADGSDDGTSAAPRRFKEAPGWFDYDDLYRQIADSLPDGGTFVELGVFEGRSLCYMAEYLQQIGKRARVVGVDLFDRADIRRVSTLIGDSVELVRSDSAAAAEMFGDASVDAIFIDADHSAAAVQRDIEAWLPKIKSEAVMAGHDLNHQWPGVQQGIEAVGVSYTPISANCWIHDRRPK